MIVGSEENILEALRKIVSVLIVFVFIQLSDLHLFMLEFVFVLVFYPDDLIL